MLAHLQFAWSQALTEGQDPHDGIAQEKRLFELICCCDPTPTARYHGWLSAWRRGLWPDRGLRHTSNIEELGEIAKALALFDSLRLSLPTGSRDINAYRSAEELMTVVALPLPSVLRAKRQLEKEAALAESDILFVDGSWRLVRIKGPKAAQWWGRGTRWCTASSTSNRYAYYALQGELLVLTTPKGKFQLSRNTNEFRDAADAPADLNIVLKNGPKELQRLSGLAP